MVYADQAMVGTVVRNLLSNALKFTYPGGTITISVMLAERAVSIGVTDTGIGIAAEDLSKLFRIDSKYKRPGTAKEKGTGLGLILCKEFVEQQGGAITIDSAVGQGTTVTVTLPQSQNQGV
jgi:signal transduction histidine kinase